MKKKFAILNAILLAVTVALCVYYDLEGGLLLKGITASAFVILGFVNLLYAVLSRSTSKKFPVWMALGLLTCMIGDVVLNIAFIPGTVIFALGHVLYFIAFCCMRKIKKTDLIPVAAVILAAVLIIKLVPFLNFGSGMMEWICLGYGVVISCMVGKTVANFLRCRDRITALQMIGSMMFFFSDLMLLLGIFGDAPRITDTLCLYSYFPAQALLAHSVYHYVNKEK